MAEEWQEKIKMKILVTGGAGFIGSHIVEHFKDQEVIVFDNLRSGFEENIKDFDVEFINSSIIDNEELKDAMDGVDYVFHLAALTSVPESMSKPKVTYNINTQGTLNVLSAAKDSGVKKVVFSSSSAIYGDNPEVPKHEEMFPDPKSPYAETKLDGENYCTVYSEKFNMRSIVLRFFNVFGPRQDPNSQYAAAIPIFIRKALKNEDVIIYGDGEQTRDFIYVKDVVNACVLVLEKCEEPTTICNVALGQQTSINDLAKRIIKLTGSQSKIKYQKERPGDIKHSYADISKLKKYGFKPSFDFDEALFHTIEYFKTIFQ